MKKYTLVKLLKATTDRELNTHCYTIQVNDLSGDVKVVENLKVKDIDKTYGRLRMEGSRFSIRYKNCWEYEIINEEEYLQRLNQWNND